MRMKRMFVVLIAVLFGFAIVGCNNQPKEDTLEWTNDDAVYVTIDKQYREQVLDDLSATFSNYNYKKVYVVEKIANEYESLNYQLLFIIDSDQEEFINQLLLNEKVKSAEKCKDLPYESFDERYLKYDSDTIKVGDTLTITMSGEADIYRQYFLYNSLYVTPVNFDENKEYTEEDFPELNNIQSIQNKKTELIINIKDSSYFNIIKTVSKLAQSKNIESVRLRPFDVIYPIWEIDHPELVEFEMEIGSITIKAVAPGKVTITYDGKSCEITIVS